MDPCANGSTQTMSSEIKCPHCKRTGIITYGFFASCISGDCTWVGPVSQTKSTKLMTDVLLNGFSDFSQRATMDFVHSSSIAKMIEEASHNRSLDITVENTLEADKTGCVNVYSPAGELDMECLSCKLHVIRAIQNMILDIDNQDKEHVADPLLKFSHKKVEENCCIYEEYGFPPIKIKLIIDKTGINRVDWEFSQETSIWQPIDWGIIDLQKGTQIHYLAVLQVDGQNFTYFAYENLDQYRWTAGVSTREFGSPSRTVKESSADNVEEAVERLRKHYDNAHNKLTEDGDPIEISWSENFGYESNIWSTCCSIVSSDIFKDDCINESLSLLDTSRRELYLKDYEESLQTV